MFEYINNNDITMVVMLYKFHFLYYNSVMSVVCVCVCVGVCVGVCVCVSTNICLLSGFNGCLH